MENIIPEIVGQAIAGIVLVVVAIITLSWRLGSKLSNISTRLDRVEEIQKSNAEGIRAVDKRTGYQFAPNEGKSMYDVITRIEQSVNELKGEKGAQSD